ncbi:hypothetical protein RRG08_061850 [Elysia crispata]|uniref:Uncharacterized protein n=1 Tax=Elysia crispata TaxID=231223 RepID=A0AAE0Z9R0_9GAST|nr:hypothetical protein RRG08_061850 [Elysia crispata]
MSPQIYSSVPLWIAAGTPSLTSLVKSIVLPLRADKIALIPSKPASLYDLREQAPVLFFYETFYRLFEVGSNTAVRSDTAHTRLTASTWWRVSQRPCGGESHSVHVVESLTASMWWRVSQRPCGGESHSVHVVESLTASMWWRDQTNTVGVPGEAVRVWITRGATCPSQVCFKWSQVEPSGAKWSQAEPSGAKCELIESHTRVVRV